MSSQIFKKTLFFIIIIIFSHSIIDAQNFKLLVYKAYLSENSSNWESLIYNYSKTQDLSVNKNQIELISFYYGYISLLLKQKNYEKAEELTQKSEEILDEALKNSPKNATLNSFKAAYIGFHINISKLSAIYLASESNKYIDKALSINSGNCQVLIDKGNILLHTPTLFGGNKNEAIVYYTKAFKLYEKRKETINNWMYINALDNLIKAYTRTEQLQKANVIRKKRNTFVQNTEK